MSECTDDVVPQLPRIDLRRIYSWYCPWCDAENILYPAMLDRINAKGRERTVELVPVIVFCKACRAPAKVPTEE